ncbi:lipopolysaccharide biosynthesis protein [Alteromonas sp. 5E99-2]|uniref:lipopolysaccharide biosynthesis protein n=1 Tax=Alteromonas sp. 5E99-2 TaxID=2817683 RepID=UPI001A98B06A|nr:lipopolysaccharide biosynthesis protein [Alteromonas sp. 5E99-2]MBO1254149.1 lipopolysaccharide biosynthesis protein [Alteromonas sp. 5E99-2]
MKELLYHWLKKPFVIFVVVPFLIYSIYQVLFATERYESQTQLLVQQPSSGGSLDPAVLLISGFSGGVTQNDTELVRAFIHSNDMLQYIKSTVDFDSHYSDSSIDLFSRLPSSATYEETLDFYIDHVDIDIDEKSSVIAVKVQGFTPEFAQQMTQVIRDRAEWFINKIGYDLAEAKLDFIKKEHSAIESKLEQAKVELLSFQRQYNLIDPLAESAALQQITSGLDGQIALKEAELATLLTSMSEYAAPVVQVKQTLVGLNQQLENERQRMIVGTATESDLATSPNGVNEILSKFSGYKVNVELALQAYTASLVSMEQSRIEAYRQLKYLVMVESPTLPEETKYPRVTYNLLLFLVLNCMLFGIVRIIVETVRELK